MLSLLPEMELLVLKSNKIRMTIPECLEQTQNIHSYIFVPLEPLLITICIRFSRETELTGGVCVCVCVCVCARARVCMCLYICMLSVERKKKIYYKEWAHMIMKIDKSPNLQSSN